MRRSGTMWLATGLLAVAATAAVAEETPRPLAIGAAAPMADVKMASVNGESFSIADIKGSKGTLIIFTCNSCPWVKAWDARIAEIGNTYARRGVGVIAINPNDPGVKSEDDFATMQDRARALGLEFPYVVDATSDVARAFGATRTPEIFLFDRKGKLVYHGAVDDNAREPQNVKSRWLVDALESALSGKAVKVKETKSLGCTIKFRGAAASS